MQQGLLGRGRLSPLAVAVLMSSRPGLSDAGLRAALFGANEPGALFYLDDALSVTGDNVFLFQDVAGTTPVTAVGQTWGLYLDRRFGLARGAELVTDGGNETGLFNGKSNPSATQRGEWSWSTDRSRGGTHSAKYTCTDATAGDHLANIQAISATDSIDVKVWVYNPSGNFVLLRLIDASDGSWSTPAVTVTDTWTLLAGIRAAKGTAWNLAVGNNGAVSGLGLVFYADDLSIKPLPGNHRTQATSTARAKLLQNATTGKLYSGPDGSDDWSSGPMNLSSTDKLTAIAAMRKTSDVAVALLTELSAVSVTNPGTFRFGTPNSAGAPNYNFTVAGTAATSVSGTTWPAPTTDVITGVADIAAARAEIRVNGQSAGVSLATQGTGNFGNYTQFYSSRAGSGLYWGGEEYALIIRGATTDAATLAQAERWAASKAGITF